MIDVFLSSPRGPVRASIAHSSPGHVGGGSFLAYAATAAGRVSLARPAAPAFCEPLANKWS